jgi:hypothetical protein
MRVKIEVTMDNAAFEDRGFVKELDAIVSEAINNPMLKHAIEKGLYYDGLIRDSNGNKVGYLYLETGDE